MIRMFKTIKKRDSDLVGQNNKNVFEMFADFCFVITFHFVMNVDNFKDVFVSYCSLNKLKWFGAFGDPLNINPAK